MPQKQNIKTLCSAPISIAQQRCSTLIDEAEAIRDRFVMAFELFASCDSIYDGKHVDASTVKELSMSITSLYVLTIYYVLL